MIIFLAIFFILFFVFIYPCTLVELKLNLESEKFFLGFINKSNENYIKLKFLGLIPIFKKNLFQNKKIKKENKIKKIINKKIKQKLKFADFFKIKTAAFNIISSISFEKFNLDLGINVGQISNAYLISLINTILCIYINKHINRFNLKKIRYSTYTSEKLLNLKFNCIIKLSIVNTIIVILKEAFKLFKSKKLTFNERSRYG